MIPVVEYPINGDAISTAVAPRILDKDTYLVVFNVIKNTATAIIKPLMYRLLHLIQPYHPENSQR